MTLEEARALRDEIKLAGYKAEVRPDYSGRAMHGRVTPAVVCNLSPTEFRALFPKTWREFALRADEMGMGWVFY